MTGIPSKKIIKQRPQISRSFPEWRDHKGNRIETVKEILPKPGLSDLMNEILIGRRDYTNIEFF